MSSPLVKQDQENQAYCRVQKTLRCASHPAEITLQQATLECSKVYRFADCARKGRRRHSNSLLICGPKPNVTPPSPLIRTFLQTLGPRPTTYMYMYFTFTFPVNNHKLVLSGWMGWGALLLWPAYKVKQTLVFFFHFCKTHFTCNIFYYLWDAL